MFYLKAAQRGWKTWLADVTAAFLQGDATEEERELRALPAPQLQEAFATTMRRRS